MRDWMGTPRRACRFSDLESLYRAALAGVDPKRAVSRALADRQIAIRLAAARAIGLFAVGKAAAAMFEGARNVGSEALVILPKGYRAPKIGARGKVLFASHPAPGRASVHAAKEAIAFFSRFGREDAILCLVSGGTSSLLSLPRAGVTLARKREAVRRLASRGAGILQLNRLRISLSAVKGGKLGRGTQARLVTLVLSDVPANRPSAVGSGPTIRRRKEDIIRVVGRNSDGIAAASREALRQGFQPRVWKRLLRGEAREEGARFARAAKRLAPGGVLIAGGETTVCIERNSGQGGRNLEFALGAALELSGSDGIALLAAGSDGKDGSSRAAGAFAEGTTLDRARRLGLDPWASLSRHDTEEFFRHLGDLFVTGLTGTNVGDWAFARRGEVSELRRYRSSRAGKIGAPRKR